MWFVSKTPRWQQLSPPETPKASGSVRKEVVEEGILHMMAAAAERQQHRDFDAARLFYAGAMRKAADSGIGRQALLTGTQGKPAPLNTHTALEWSLLTGDLDSALVLKGSANALLEMLAANRPLDGESISTLIVDKGANVDHRVGGDRGWTLLHAAAEAGDLDVVERLLDHCALVDCLDDRGATALHWAAGCQASQAAAMVKRLLTAGFNARARDGEGQSILQAALLQGTPDTVAALLEALQPRTDADRKQIAAWSDATAQAQHHPAAASRLKRIFDILDAAGVVVSDRKLTLAPATIRKQPEAVVTNKPNSAGFDVHIHVENFAKRYAKDRRVDITFAARNRTWTYVLRQTGAYLRLTKGAPLDMRYSVVLGQKTLTTVSLRKFAAGTTDDSWGWAKKSIPKFNTLEFSDSPLLDKKGALELHIDCNFDP